MSFLLIVYSVLFLIGVFYCLQRLDSWIESDILSQHNLRAVKKAEATEGCILIVGCNALSEGLVKLCTQKGYPYCNITELAEMGNRGHCKAVVALASDEENLLALSLFKTADYPVYTIGTCRNQRLLWMYRQVGTDCILEDADGAGDAQLLRMVKSQVEALFLS